MDNIIINGFPKTGNHAVQKACELLGFEFKVNHMPYEKLPSGFQCIFMKRDPRNIVISMLRMRGIDVTVENFVALLTLFTTDTLIDEMAKYEGWLTDPNTLLVAYEDIIKDKGAMETIANYLGTQYQDGLFEQLEGLTFTYNAVHSDYTTVWNADFQSAWDAAGGTQLLTRWGY